MRWCATRRGQRNACGGSSAISWRGAGALVGPTAHLPPQFRQFPGESVVVRGESIEAVSDVTEVLGDLVESAVDVVEPAVDVSEPAVDVSEPAVDIAEPAVDIAEPTQHVVTQRAEHLPHETSEGGANRKNRPCLGVQSEFSFRAALELPLR